MRARIVMAWGASVLAALLIGMGLTGPGTRAEFSDSVTLTQEIRTGRVVIVLTTVDGTVLAEPSDSYHVSDRLTSTTVDVGHDVTIRNDGSLDVGSMSLTMSPSTADLAPEAAKLVFRVSSSSADGDTATESHPLSYWLAEPRAFASDLDLAPGDSVEVGLHLSGDLAAVDEGQTVELTYQFTASAR